MRWNPSAENATVFCWKHCSMPIIVVCFMDQEFWQIFSQNIWCYRIKKKMKLMGKMKTKAWFQVLIFESLFTHGRETSRHMRLLFDDHFLYGSDESEKNLQSHLLTLFHVRKNHLRRSVSGKITKTPLLLLYFIWNGLLSPEPMC